MRDLGIRSDEGTCEEGEARAEREAFRRREAIDGRLPACGMRLLACEGDGVSAQPSISDGNAVGNSGDEALQNMIEMLSADRLSCLESESIVR